MRYERVVFVLPSSYFSWECVWLFADKRKLTDWSVIKWWRKRCSECNHNKILAVQSFLPFWGGFNLSSCVGQSMIVQCHYWFHSQLKVGNSQLVGCNYNFRDCVCVSLSDIILSLGFGVNSFQSCVRVQPLAKPCQQYFCIYSTWEIWCYVNLRCVMVIKAAVKRQIWKMLMVSNNGTNSCKCTTKLLNWQSTCGGKDTSLALALQEWICIYSQLACLTSLHI